ncbi:MAG: hypothetical protein WCF84_17985 [Anaerolineae bacterium]
MQTPTIIYYGAAGLQAQVLSSYFSNLHCRFETAHSIEELIDLARHADRAIVILALDDSPPHLIRIARQVIPNPSSAFPHVFILYGGEPFDTQLETITLVTGSARLRRVADEIMALIRRLPSRTTTA